MLPERFFSVKIFAMEIHTFRLRPGDSLRKSIQKYAAENSFSAGLVLSVVGGLKEVNLRMPGATPTKQVVKTLKHDLEIVSIQGTVEKDDCHIHISVSGKTGKVYGGHLKEGVVRITAEVSLLELPDRKFLREFDPETGFNELVVKYLK